MGKEHLSLGLHRCGPTAHCENTMYIDNVTNTKSTVDFKKKNSMSFLLAVWSECWNKELSSHHHQDLTWTQKRNVGFMDRNLSCVLEGERKWNDPSRLKYNVRIKGGRWSDGVVMKFHFRSVWVLSPWLNRGYLSIRADASQISSLFTHLELSAV